MPGTQKTLAPNSYFFFGEITMIICRPSIFGQLLDHVPIGFQIVSNPLQQAGMPRSWWVPFHGPRKRKVTFALVTLFGKEAWRRLRILIGVVTVVRTRPELDFLDLDDLLLETWPQ